MGPHEVSRRNVPIAWESFSHKHQKVLHALRRERFDDQVPTRCPRLSVECFDIEIDNFTRHRDRLVVHYESSFLKQP